MADSRPAPGPLTFTSNSTTPCFLASLAHHWAARCAAKGVLLRAPVNFFSPPPRGTAPADDQQSTSPLASVIETTVLLKVALMCATALATLRLVRRFPAALAKCDSSAQCSMLS